MKLPRLLAVWFLTFGTSFFFLPTSAQATCVNTAQAAIIAAAAEPTAAGETPTVTVLETCGGDDVSYQVPISTAITYDGVQYDRVYATTNSVITFGQPDGTYWTYPATPSISIQSMDWVVYPNQRNDEHLIISGSDGGFQVDISARPIFLQSAPETTNIIITAAINTDGTVAISYVLSGTDYSNYNWTRTGARLNDGTVVPLEEANITRVEVAPTLAPTPEPTPSPSAFPTPTDSPSPSVEPTTQPLPSPSPEPSQSPSPTPSPTPSLEPSPTPSPSPIVEPQPTPQPEPEPAPQPAPEPPVVRPEPQPQPVPVETPAPTPVEPAPPLAEEPPVEPPVPVEESPAPAEEPPVVEEQPPVEEPPAPPVAEESPVPPVEEEQPAPTPEPLPEPVEEPVPASQPEISSEPPSVHSVDLESLPPSTPVELDNGVIVTAQVAIAVELLGNPTELLSTMFTDPGAAFAALGSVGADLPPEVREEAEKIVISAIIAGNIATSAAATAAAGATYRRKP